MVINKLINFVVYKSSAGSGKTFTLVKEYLKLALAEEKKLTHNFKRILAITFTNKAAAEMKIRVIEALHSISQNSEFPTIGKILCNELKLSESEITNRSKIVLESILHNYSDLSISTIDSFTHKLVKTFAYDLRLPVNFEIELNVNSFYQNVVSNLLSTIGEDEYISKLLKEYSLTRANDNTAWDPETSILELTKMLTKEDAETYTKKLQEIDTNELEEARKEIINTIKLFKQKTISFGQSVLKIIEENNVEEISLKGKSKFINFFTKFSNANFNIDDYSSPTFTGLIQEKSIINTSVKNPDSALLKASNKIIEIILEQDEYIAKNEKLIRLCEILNKQIYPLLLIKKIEELAKEKKDEEQIVFISEFNKTIFELINNEPTPFIYERIGEKYHHYLLDEFQDTSTLQFQNIIPLLDNSLSNGWYNLIVGDGKQSIYRWRNANVKQFANLPKVISSNNIMAERELSLQRNYHEKFLDTNYRSTKTIVEFNNSFFENVSSKVLSNDYRNIYFNQTQKFINEQTGYVTVNTGKVDKNAVEEQNYNLILNYIDKALSKNYSYKDICIIGRTNKALSKISEVLNKNNIPVLASESLLIGNTIEVNTILSFLKCTVNYKDLISAASVVNYLFQSQQISEIDFANCLNTIKNHNSVFEILNDLGYKIDKEKFILENLVDNCIYIASTLNLNKTNSLAIRFFIDEVTEYLVSKSSNVIGFLHWWDTRKNKASLLLPENTNAVKVMTIHNSKGLEFPIVIIPFCNWELYSNDLSFLDLKNKNLKLPVGIVSVSKGLNDAGYNEIYNEEIQTQELDNLNLLYVAFTRAVNKLHIITIQSTGQKKPTVNKYVETYANENLIPVSENFYSVGEDLQKHTSKKEKNYSSFPLNQLQLIENNSTIKIKQALSQYNNNISIALEQGLILHTIFSKIKTKYNIETAINNAFLEGLIEKNEIEIYREKIIKLINLPELEVYFSVSNIKLEEEILCSNGNVLRPDRVVFFEDKITVIDYKTGKQHADKYKKQLTTYKNALQEMGHKNIELLLVYINELIVEKI